MYKLSVIDRVYRSILRYVDVHVEHPRNLSTASLFFVEGVVDLDSLSLGTHSCWRMGNAGMKL